MQLIAGILKVIIPWLQEYFTSSLRRTTDLSQTVMWVTVSTCFLWMFLLITYLNEQARNNLDMHRPLAETNKQLLIQKNQLSTKLGEERKLHKNCLLQLKVAEEATCQP